MIADATVESWSHERGRGTVRFARGGSLPFDASVAEIGGLVVGEHVHVTLEAADGRVRVVRLAPVERDENSGAPFPYHLPLWRSSYAATSPSGERRAEIARATEHAMGGPTLGRLRTSDGLVLERCSPSFVWSDCSRYLAVAQSDSFVGIVFAMRVVVIGCERRVVWRSKRHRGWLQPESFTMGVLRAVRDPFASARRVAWRIPP